MFKLYEPPEDLGKAQATLAKFLNEAIEELFGPPPEPTLVEKVTAYARNFVAMATTIIVFIPLLLFHGIRQGLNDAMDLIDPGR